MLNLGITPVGQMVQECEALVTGLFRQIRFGGAIGFLLDSRREDARIMSEQIRETVLQPLVAAGLHHLVADTSPSTDIFNGAYSICNRGALKSTQTQGFHSLTKLLQHQFRE